MTQDRN